MDEYQSLSELLPPQTRDWLETLEVELLKNGATFRRKLNEKEMQEVWRILAGLAYALGEEDPLVFWARADWTNQVKEWFGENALEVWWNAWMKDDLELEPRRNELYRSTGATLFYIQMLEASIADCCLLLEHAGTSVSLEELLSNDAKRREKTMGKLAIALKGFVQLDDTFAERLSKFVEDRNRFVHRMWHEEIQQADFGHPLLQTLEEFVQHVYSECYELRTVFRGIGLVLVRELEHKVWPASTHPITFRAGKWETETMIMAKSLIQGPGRTNQ